MSELKIILVLVNGGTVLVTCAIALVSLFAEGEYRLGQHLPPLTYSLAMKFWLVAQVGLMVAAVAVVFIIPSMLLASRRGFEPLLAP